MERQTKGSRGMEAYCKGGHGPPRAVAPPKKKTNKLQAIIYKFYDLGFKFVLSSKLFP